MANPVLSPSYPAFTLVPLGSISGLPAGFQYEGLGFNGSTLLISGDGLEAGAGFQNIYSVSLTRDGSGNINGFGSTSLYATVPSSPGAVVGVPLLGGLLFAPDGTLLYTTGPSSVNSGPVQTYIGQYSPSSLTSSLTAINDSGGNAVPMGGLGYLPNGQLVVSATDGTWRLLTLSNQDANGLYQLSAGSPIAGVNAPADSFANFAGGVNANVPNASVLVGDSVNQQLALYTLDGGGNPTGAGSQLVNGNGESIGFGITRDPQHPQVYLFTTENNDVWMLTADTPEPSAGVLAGCGVLLLAVRRRRRMRSCRHVSKH